MKLFSEHLGETVSFEPLNEAQEKYDIKQKYDYFNKLLFSGKLPSNFKLRFSRTKKAGGAVITSYWTKGRGSRKTITDWEIKELFLSSFFLRTEEQIDSILVHEMIHVWLTVNGMHEGYNVKYHGPEFVAKMGELQSKVPFKISLYDTPDMRGDVDSTVKTELGVVMTLVDDIPDSIIVFTKDTLNKNIEKLKDILKKNLDKGTEIIFGTSNHPEIQQFTVKRTLSKMSLYVLKSEMYDNIKSSFNEFERFKIEGETDIELKRKKDIDSLFTLQLKLASSKPNSKKQEELKAQVNVLRKELGMELMDFK